MLLVDKHRPTSLDKMEIHVELNRQLKQIATPVPGEGLDLPHLLFYGPSGAGKKSRIMALLRHIYGSRVEKLKIETKEMKVGSQGTKTITLTSLSSPHHIELTPSDAGFNDRYVISQMFKEIAESAPVLESAGAAGDSSAAAASSAAAQGTAAGLTRMFKIVVMNEVDSLTKEAQQALRRTMEKYMRTCRVILCATSTSKVIDPVKSRCLCIRVPAPTEPEIVTALERIAKSEGLILPRQFAETLSSSCDRNLRRAILMLEAAKVQRYPFAPDQQVALPDWEVFINDIGSQMISEQSPARLLEVREKLYALITSCIPPEIIMKKLTDYLISHTDYDMQHQVAYWAAHYEHRLKQGSRAIFHLEAFVARFMSLFKEDMLRAFQM